METLGRWFLVLIGVARKPLIGRMNPPCSGEENFLLFEITGNSQGGVSPKCHRFVEFAFDGKNLGDLGLRI